MTTNKESILIDLDFIDSEIDGDGLAVVKFGYIVEHIWVHVRYTKEYEHGYPHAHADILHDWCFEVNVMTDAHAGDRALVAAYMNAAVQMHIALFDDEKLRALLPIYEAKAKEQKTS